MQKKISKNHLLTISLAILLAISIAMTVSFAAFDDTKTATGSITFQGNVITTIQLGTAKTVVTAISSFSSGSATLTISNINTATNGSTLATELAGIKVGLGANSTAAKFSVLVSVSGTAAAALTVSPVNSVSGYTKNGSLWQSSNTISANTTKALSDFYTFTFNEASIPSNAASSTATITIKVGANTTTAPSLS